MADIKEFYNLDFDALKEQFKTFISGQTEFKDYNFEGAALSQLLDVFTFSIQYQQMYLNMTINELFLDTAQIDVNIFKLANTLNYIPKRKSAAYIWTGLQRNNDIINGEEWTGAGDVVQPDPPEDWEIATGVVDGEFTIVDDSANESAHDGADAVLKIYQNSVNAKLTSQSFATQIGKNYTFTVRYRTGAIQPARVLIGVANDMAGELHDSIFLSVVAGNWYLKTINFTATNALTYFTLGGGSDSAGESVYFDECRLTRNLSITINKFSTFTMGSLNLTNFEDIIINDNEIHLVRLYEGDVTEQTWVASGGNFQEYTLDYRDEVDGLNVFVDSPDGSGGFVVSTIPWINVNTETFELNDAGFYINHFEDLTIKFGDSQRFQVPLVNDQIRIIYIKTAGDTVNGNVATIAIDSSVTYHDELTMSVLGILKNGTAEESIDSIRQNAPLFYTTQNRAVTADDHNILIKRFSKYDAFFDAFLWGGELEYVEEVEDPPASGAYVKRLVEYWPTKEFPYIDVGHVYSTAIHTDFSYLDDTEISDLIDFLNITKNVSIFYRFLQPQIIHISPTINITHESILDFSTETIASQIDTYLNTYQEGFNKVFHLSNLIKYVDAINEVIDTSITFTSRVTVKDAGYVAVRLWNEIVPGSVSGLVNGNLLTDNGAGVLYWNSQIVGSISYTGDVLTGQTGGCLIINQDDYVSFGLAADSTYDLNFTYASSRTVELNRESFMLFDPIVLNAVVYTETN
jgi:hypothetical protein